MTLPYGLNVSSMISVISGSPFEITTGLDENGDTEINDRPAGLKRNADLSASLYGLLPDRLICPPGPSVRTPSGGAAGACNPGSGPMIQLRDFLAERYPEGVKAVGPGSFNVNLFLSKSFGFGKRPAQGVQGQKAGDKKQDAGGGASGKKGLGGGESARFNLTFTLGINNLFNRVNHGQFGGVLGSAYFGIPSSAGPARRLDLGVRLNF